MPILIGQVLLSEVCGISSFDHSSFHASHMLCTPGTIFRCVAESQPVVVAFATEVVAHSDAPVLTLLTISNLGFRRGTESNFFPSSTRTLCSRHTTKQNSQDHVVCGLRCAKLSGADSADADIRHAHIRADAILAPPRSLSNHYIRALPVNQTGRRRYQVCPLRRHTSQGEYVTHGGGNTTSSHTDRLLGLDELWTWSRCSRTA